MGFFSGPAAVALGFLLDLLLGDPPGIPHPVRGMGFLIARGEGVLRRLLPGNEGAAGTLLAILVTVLSLFLSGGVLFFAYGLNRWAGFTAEVILCWQVLSARDLQIESMRVYRAAVRGDLAGARKAVSMIVGRDTAALSMEQVIRAAVETVAENLSDGVIAPLFFLALGGPPLGMFYKAVNTLDSMIGYKNRRYIRFGRTAAKLDDLANRLPARVSARLMIAAAAVLGFDAKNAARIYRRDRGLHPSPNSGHPESACAGALGIALGGKASYFGEIHEKAVLGDPLRPVTAGDIKSAIRLMYGASLLFLPAACFVRLAAGFAAARGGWYVP
ncbi:MAG: adenosylcobinamide-phosphate synthase CbiB [Spirochaetaceae bacterium]|jgi:adenosylcobinamide-phosphate synthase|nr:adenosylcobinamide-phosphate synthase CbiB [Spirochaetaceae bacterium]